MPDKNMIPQINITYRPTWAEVNLGNLAYNFSQIKKILAPKVKIMACVKADAYGHGIIHVSKKLEDIGADYLGVASIEEGISIRGHNIDLPILILGMIFKRDTQPLLKYNLTPTLCDDDFARILNNMGRKNNKIINVHIKVDTGMSRIGVLYKDALDFIKRVRQLKFINIEGIFTHLACADINRDYTLHQISLFDRLVSQLNKIDIHIPLVHAANSMGIIGYRMSHFNMVRPGLILYGLYPKLGLKVKLKPVLGLKTRVIYCKRLPKGQGISYGHTYLTKRESTIVTLPIGYGDGYPRNLSNRASVLIKGRPFKISGRVCMDQIMVDVENFPVRAGEKVVLIGSSGKKNITAEDLAILADTIPYEVVCGLGSRIPRIYI